MIAGTTTAARLAHAREIIGRAIAVLAPIEIDESADTAETLRIATAIETRANLAEEEERITRRIGPARESVTRTAAATARPGLTTAEYAESVRNGLMFLGEHR